MLFFMWFYSKFIINFYKNLFLCYFFSSYINSICNIWIIFDYSSFFNISCSFCNCKCSLISISYFRYYFFTFGSDNIIFLLKLLYILPQFTFIYNTKFINLVNFLNDLFGTTKTPFKVVYAMSVPYIALIL